MITNIGEIIHCNYFKQALKADLIKRQQPKLHFILLGFSLEADPYHSNYEIATAVPRNNL